MDPQSTVSPAHAEVFNPQSYSLKNALGPQPAQLKPDPNEATFQEETEVADSPSLLCHPGYVDQPCLSDIAAKHIFVPTHGGLVYVSGHPVNNNYLESRSEYSNRQIRRQPITPATVAATGLAEVRGREIRVYARCDYSNTFKAGNRASQANSPSASQKNNYHNCEPKKCLYPGLNGKRCSQEITCAKVSEHFVIHGITNKHRDEAIPCEWDGCSRGVVRHNFVRHIREKHLGHVRSTTPKKNADTALPERRIS
ncbi:hypothetical protein PISMIDRAFT_15442 [Pisolithus microcarpus 441]|uniref:Uncharacterized protein n=1 Tax=Pisolithus microcarpus 441 TaxID=765257 RepID=A0A0C9XX48_9AGAM|nr:hypothetical protein PISMIDRAFT_15442 [Pisolithus microcarpus 441]